MFDDFDTQIQFDELAALNSIYWEIDNPADWENLGEKDEGEEQGGLIILLLKQSLLIEII